MHTVAAHRGRAARFALVATAAPTTHGRDETTPPWRWGGPTLELAGVALVGGVVLRFIAPSPLWLDEALSVEIAGRAFGDMVDALRHDGHPSLYYLLLGWWMDVFGESNGAARSLSAIASIATVPVLWALGRRRSPAVGAVAALVGLSSPYLLRYGTEARMYALLTLLVALGWLSVERAIDRPDPRRLATVAVTTAALIHTHYWSFWLIGATLLVLGVTAVRDKSRGPTMWPVIGAVATGAATFVVWLGVFFEQLGSTGTPWADRARPAEIAVESMQAIGGNNRFEGELLGVVLVVFALIGAYGVHRDRVIELRPGRPALTGPTSVAVITLALGGGIALVSGGAFEGRYTAVVVPVILLLAARGLALVPGPARIAAAALVVLFGLAIGVDEARRDRTQAGDVAALINAGHQPGDIVAFCPDQVGPSTHRALDAGIHTVAYPRGDGLVVDWQDYEATIGATPAEDFVALVDAAAGGNDIWLVVGLGYKNLDNRCEAIIEQLGRTHHANHLISPTEVFEPMLLSRYEPAR